MSFKIQTRLGKSHAKPLAERLLERPERGIETFQSAAHSLSGSAKSDAKVLGLLEKVSGDHAGLELFRQGFHKCFRIADPKPRKYRRTEAARLTIQLRMVLQEFVHQRTVRFEQIPSAIAHTVQVVEGDYA